LNAAALLFRCRKRSCSTRESMTTRPIAYTAPTDTAAGTLMTHTAIPLQPLNSRVEHIFPTLTPAQIARIAAHGRTRPIQRGEIIVEQGDLVAPFFVVTAGEVEVVRPSMTGELLVTVHRPGQFSGAVNMLSCRRALMRA